MTLRLLPYTPERDAYRLLGVPPTASLDEIGAACRRLARTFHPDHNVSPRANQEMQVVNAVRKVMNDPEWRAAYDRERRRFHAARYAGTTVTHRVAHPLVHLQPLQIERQPSSPLARYARAFTMGLRAAVMALAPPRCLRCRMLIETEDAYCIACGTPLLDGG